MRIIRFLIYYQFNVFFVTIHHYTVSFPVQNIPQYKNPSRQQRRQEGLVLNFTAVRK